MVSLRRTVDSDKIDLEAWEFGFYPEALRNAINKDIGRCVTEAIEATLRDRPPNIWMPFRRALNGWTEDARQKAAPLLITVEFPLSDDDINEPAWEISLSELIDDLIEWHQEEVERLDATINKDDAACETLQTLAKALRREAEKLEEACRPKRRQHQEVTP